MANKNTKLLGVGVVAASLALLGSASPIQAAGLTPEQVDGLNLRSAAGYGIINIAPTSETFAMNSGPVAGNFMGFNSNNGSVIVGGGTEVSFSGGNDGEITGTLFYDPATNANTGGGGVPGQADDLENGVANLQQVTNAFTAMVRNDALAVSNYASNLIPDLTFGSLPDDTNIVGSGGLTVINLTEINNADFTLTGSAMDYFVFNVSDKIQTNRVMTLNGVNPSQILFNLTGTGTVFQTSGGNILSGTFLSPNGGDFQFSNLALTGSLINIDGSVQYVSGSEQTGDPFFVVPEPLTILGAGTAVGFGAFFKRQVAKKRKDEKETAEV